MGDYMKNKIYAMANISGSRDYQGIRGTVTFITAASGVMVTAHILGLPARNDCTESGVFGFHIHEGRSCTGNSDDEFKDALGHYNPSGCLHPYHAGDMPPLFSCKGEAYLSFLTDRFEISDILGRTVVIHSNPDDFTTQPSGNSGTKIACGVIERIK